IEGGPQAAGLSGPLKDSIWQGNIIWNTAGGAGDIPAAGFTAVDPQLKLNDTGRYGLVSTSSPAIGAAVGSYLYVTIDVQGRRRGTESTVGAELCDADGAALRALNQADVGIHAVEAHRAIPASHTDGN